MKYIVSLIIILLFVSCGTSSDDTTNKKYTIIEESDDIINRLNEIRQKSGMIKLTTATSLVKSSYNHAYYLDTNNLSGHIEEKDKKNFTGEHASNRVLYTGFRTKFVSENVSIWQKTKNDSLEGLMSAIYHRFGFLDFEINTIGFAKIGYVYVYNMSNSDINDLCYGNNYEKSGYVSLCKDKSFRIQYSKYINTLNKTINSNPMYVIYPYRNQKDVQTVFFEETPDPLPTYNVSGYPISIEFNKNHYNMENFSINSFIIYDNNNNVLELAKDFLDSNSILSMDNDVNKHITDKYKYAIFPAKRLEYGKTYNVEFSYNINGNSKKIKWSFTTKTLPNLININNETNEITIDNNKSYNLFIEPINKNDILNKRSIVCFYKNSIIPKLDISFYDRNTIKLKVEGEDINYCNLKLYKNNIETRTIKININ